MYLNFPTDLYAMFDEFTGACSIETHVMCRIWLLLL